MALRIGRRQEKSHVLQSVEVVGHVCGQDHVNDEGAKQLEVLLSEILQNVQVSLAGGREKEVTPFCSILGHKGLNW